MGTQKRPKIASSMLSACALSFAGGIAESAQPPALTAETSDVATLAPATPHRFFTIGYRDSVVIFDGDSGKLEGQVPIGHDATFNVSADNSRLYVGETMWAHGNRGERFDLLSIYDAKTLNLLKEIALPGRALVLKLREVAA